MIIFTTIQPSNTYKKHILSQVKDKELTCHNCNILNSYFVVINYNLFDCKSAISMKLLIQKEQNKNKHETLIELKRQLFVLEHLIENMKSIQQKSNKKIELENIPEPQRSYFNQLMINNEHIKVDTSKYYNDCFRKAYNVLIMYQNDHFEKEEEDSFQDNLMIASSRASAQSCVKQLNSKFKSKHPLSEICDRDVFGYINSAQQLQRIKEVQEIIEKIQNKIK